MGGAFSRIGSAVRRRLAAFDATTGALTAWHPGVTPDTTVGVSALMVDRGTLYAGGLFDAIDGQKRANLAAFDVASGALTAWNPRSDYDVVALAPSGDTVFVGDARTGKVLPWRADVAGGSEAWRALLSACPPGAPPAGSAPARPGS